MKQVGIVLLTYASGIDNPRHLYALKTLECLLSNVRFTDIIRWHIADDGSPKEHIDALTRLCPDASISSSARKGYGASYNLATQILHSSCDYLMMVEDDWELTKPLDLDPLTRALDEGINCIRLGYLGWTQELKGHIMSAAQQTFLMFEPDSPEPHVWSGHPRIETREFQRKIGPWPEGLDPGTTEFVVAHKEESREGVVWPLDLGIRAGQIQGTLFSHIGSVQARSDQVATI